MFPYFLHGVHEHLPKVINLSLVPVYEKKIKLKRFPFRVYIIFDEFSLDNMFASNQNKNLFKK